MFVSQQVLQKVFACLEKDTHTSPGNEDKEKRLPSLQWILVWAGVTDLTVSGHSLVLADWLYCPCY